MKHSFLKMIAFSLCLAITSASCQKKAANNSNNGGGGSTNEVQTVVGRVTDTQGKGVAHAKVRAQNDVFNGFSETYTDANGYYKLPKLNFGGWVIYAWSEVQYNNHTYYLRMGMPALSDYGSFQPDASGAVTKNFVWTLQGNIPDRTRSEQNPAGYWGGMLRFSSFSAPNDNVQYLPNGTNVTVTLTPEAGAKKFDGSTGQTITKSFVVGNNINYYFYDIPQCSYQVTAKAVVNGITRNLSLATQYNGTYTSSLNNVYFMPAGTGGYENGMSNLLSVQSTDGPIYMKIN